METRIARIFTLTEESNILWSATVMIEEKLIQILTEGPPKKSEGEVKIEITKLFDELTQVWHLAEDQPTNGQEIVF